MSQMHRKVLLIAYEFPPSGGGGVQRVAKFARYLPEFGWDPLVVAAEPVKGRPLDESLAEEVTTVPVARVPARHVGMAVSRVLAVARGARDTLRRRRVERRAPSEQANSAAASRDPSGGFRPGRTAQLTQWLASPDFAAYWVAPAVAAGIRVGREAGVFAVLASSPPFSALVAGARVAEALRVPLVADFRDAWRDNPGTWYPTAWHRNRSLALERRVLEWAAAVTCVSPPIEKEALEMGGHNASVLPNGFDPADVAPWAPDQDPPATIVFMGTLYPALSDPRTLFEAMRLAGKRSGHAAQLRLWIVGRRAPFAIEAAQRAGVADRVDFLGYLPHAEAIATVARADAGVVLIRDAPEAASVYAAKIFEYLGIGIPILLLGPVQGVAADLVREAGAGWVVAHGDVESIAQTIVRIAEDKAAGKRHAPPAPSVVARFDRRTQAAQLAKILDSVVAK